MTPTTDFDRVEGINRALARRLGGDPQCWNVDRLLRVPGTTNWPTARKRAEGRTVTSAAVAAPDAGARFTLDCLAAAFPPEARTCPMKREAIAVGPYDLLTADTLSPAPGERLRALIDQPAGNDRSGDVAACAHELMRCGYSDVTAMGVLMNPANAVHAHIADQSAPERAAMRAIGFAHESRPAAVFADAPVLPDGASIGIETLDLVALGRTKAKPKRFVVPKLAPAGEVTLFTGPGSAGKSLLAQQLATAIAAGFSTLGLELAQAPAIYLTCEDDAEQLHWRQNHICQSLGVSMERLAGKLHLASLRGELDNALGSEGADGAFIMSSAFHRLGTLIRMTGAAFVALDNVAHLFVGNENDRGQVTRFVNALNRLAGETGAAILLLGHPNKSGDTYSGSTAWLNAVRSQVVIEHDLATDMRTLKVGKANYARNGDAIRFAWVDWAFVLEDDLPADVARALADTARANAENAAFLRCLEVCTDQRRNVSHQPGINYAPTIFSGMTETKGVKKAGFTAAMERLLALGQIELDVELWPGPNRHPKRGIRAKGGEE